MRADSVWQRPCMRIPELPAAGSDRDKGGDMRLFTLGEEVNHRIGDHACPVCVELAETEPGEKLGRIMSVDEASGVIPAHPQCRCTWVSVLEER